MCTPHVLIIVAAKYKKGEVVWNVKGEGRKWGSWSVRMLDWLQMGKGKKVVITYLEQNICLDHSDPFPLKCVFWKQFGSIGYKVTLQNHLVNTA